MPTVTTPTPPRTAGSLTAADLWSHLQHGKTGGLLVCVEHAPDGETGMALRDGIGETWLYLSHDEPVTLTPQDHEW